VSAFFSGGNWKRKTSADGRGARDWKKREGARIVSQAKGWEAKRTTSNAPSQLLSMDCAYMVADWDKSLPSVTRKSTFRGRGGGQVFGRTIAIYSAQHARAPTAQKKKKTSLRREQAHSTRRLI